MLGNQKAGREKGGSFEDFGHRAGDLECHLGNWKLHVDTGSSLTSPPSLGYCTIEAQKLRESNAVEQILLHLGALCKTLAIWLGLTDFLPKPMISPCSHPLPILLGNGGDP